MDPGEVERFTGQGVGNCEFGPIRDGISLRMLNNLQVASRQSVFCARPG